MKRSNRILLIAHCVINQNTVVYPYAREKGAFAEVTSLIVSQGFGLHQLPCPETLHLGIIREPMTKEQYNIPEYVALCGSLAESQASYMQLLQRGGIEVSGIIGIGESPTCSQFGRVGHFMEALSTYEVFSDIPKIDIPETYGTDATADESFLRSLNHWLMTL